MTDIEIARLRKHLRQSSDIITEVQTILTEYLADPIYSLTTIARLLELLDNHEIVDRQAEWAAALARVKP